jgi:hypothetical protein
MWNKKEIDDVPVYKEYEIQTPKPLFKKDVDERVDINKGLGVVPKDDKDKPPVHSTYTAVKYDLYTLYNEFSSVYTSYVSMTREGRSGGKELKNYRLMMLKHAVDFWQRTRFGWSRTKNRMLEYQMKEYELFNKEVLSSDNTYYYLFSKLMFKIEDKKGYEPAYDDYVIVASTLSLFMSVSGIFDIEDKFQEEKDNEFGYGG